MMFNPCFMKQKRHWIVYYVFSTTNNALISFIESQNLSGIRFAKTQLLDVFCDYESHCDKITNNNAILSAKYCKVFAYSWKYDV